MEIIPDLSDFAMMVVNLIIACIAALFVWGAPVKEDKKREKLFWTIALIGVVINTLAHFIIIHYYYDDPPIWPGIMVCIGYVFFTSCTGVLFLNIYFSKIKFETALIVSLLIALCCNNFTKLFPIQLLYISIAFVCIGWAIRKIDLTPALIMVAYGFYLFAGPILNLSNVLLDATEADRKLFIVGIAIKISLISAIYKTLGIKATE